MSVDYDPLQGQRPAPIPLNFTKAFWEGARCNKLLLQYCPTSRRYQFYPRPVSIYTGLRNLEWREASGRGTVYSFSLSSKAPPPFKINQLFIVATIELEEGVRIVTNLVDCDPETVAIDIPVRLKWVKAGEDNYPVFTPA